MGVQKRPIPAAKKIARSRKPKIMKEIPCRIEQMEWRVKGNDTFLLLQTGSQK
jgi:hypothetical protein